jgi:N-acetylmuramoyl-L-alanine amidase
MNFRNSILLLISVLAFASCKTRKPAIVINNNEKVYKSQMDSLVDLAKVMQPIPLTDSTGAAIPSAFVGTVNFNLRKPNYVIIHHTAQDSTQQTLNTFTLARTQVSAHYVVGRDGKVIHMLNDYLRAWHAGVSKWGSVTDMNSCSIGIELDNNGLEPFQDAQIKSLPWKTLAQSGFGYWSDEVLELPPPNFDYVSALRLIGYNTKNLPGAIIAFKLHFIQNDVSPELTQLDLNVLYNVSKKYADSL